MGNISKLILTVILSTIIGVMLYLKAYEINKYLFFAVCLVCVGVGAKLWLD